MNEEQKLIELLTSIVREADESHEQVGGSTRHWVRDCLLPTVEARGYWLVLQPQSEKSGTDETAQ